MGLVGVHMISYVADIGTNVNTPRQSCGSESIIRDCEKSDF